MDASGIPIASTSSNDSASETPLYLALGKYSVIIGRPSCLQGFPCGSAGKESTCNVGDLNPIPGLGRSPGEGKGYPLRYSGLGNSMDCGPPGSSVHWISQARILEWVSIPFSRGSSQPRDRTHISCIGRWIRTTEPPGKPPG